MVCYSILLSLACDLAPHKLTVQVIWTLPKYPIITLANLYIFLSRFFFLYLLSKTDFQPFLGGIRARSPRHVTHGPFDVRAAAVSHSPEGHGS